MADIGTAYVRIEPTAKGISGKIEQELGGVGVSSGKAFNKGFGSVIGGIGAATIGAVTAASAAAAGIAKSAVSNFADYQQLVGGVETLFGDAADTVIKNADNAFKTAGMGANEYMETVTSFSASLLQSLGGDTQQAASVADMALIDMADNANKMGTSMEMIQNAYQGFSKQNYTMLDNLKLGYGGTKTEMERLLKDAQELTGVEYDISSLADVYNAIHAIQEEIGITGTTAIEADDTITGSFNSVKGAWDNLLTGLASGQDISPLIDNLVNTIATSMDNILPIIEQSLIGIGDLVTKLVPIISERLPVLIEQLLPPMLSAISTLVLGIVEALPSIITILVQTLPTIITQIITALIDALPILIQGLIQLVVGIVQALPEIITALIDAMPMIITSLVSALIDAAPLLLSAGIQLTIALASGIIQAIPQALTALISLITNLISTIKDRFPEFLAKGKELIQQFLTGMLNLRNSARNAILQIYSTIRDAISGVLSSARSWGRDLISNFVNGIWDKIGAVRDAVSNIASTVWSYLHFSEPDVGPLANFHTYAPDMVELFAQGLNDNTDVLQSQMQKTFTPPMVDDMANSASYAPYNASNSNSDILSLLSQYLPLLGQENNVNVVLEGDADGLFRKVRTEASRFAKSTGYSPFPA